MPGKSLVAAAALAGAALVSGAAEAATFSFDGDLIHAYFLFPTVSDVRVDLGPFAAPGGA